MKQHLATILVLSFAVGTISALPATSTAQTSASASSAGMPSDSDLRAMARKSLEQDPSFSPEARNVHIKVKDGRASISGSANSIEEKQAIRTKVMAVEGIKSVDDQVQIRE